MIHLDFETYSPADLKAVGAEVYAEHPETEVLCAAWATEEGPTRLWLPGDEIPAEWEREEVWCAWNAPFEMAICRHVLPRLGIFLPVEPRNWRCAMAAALHKGLPAALDKAALVTRIDQTKDAEGKRLMQRLAKPRKPTKKNPATRHIPTPEELHRLGEYCAQDVRTERAMLALTGHLPPAWQQLWEETTRMNLTGVKIDLDMCAGAQRAMADFTAELEGQLRTLTGGAVQSGTKLNDMKAWLDQRGYFVPDMTADTVQSIIDDTAAPDEVRELARLRQQLSKSSSSKYAAMERATCRDGRAKNLVQCHGATTGRDAGRLFQYQNLPRPTPDFEDASYDEFRALCVAIKEGSVDLLQLMYGDLEVALTNGLRPTLIAEPGSRFIAADLAGIENRVIAAYGGEEWKLDIFREIDRGVGRDIYCRTADTIFGFEVRKKDHPVERQVGKICLGPGTPVITDSGVKPLTSVTKDDLLWDGGGWVAHGGAVYQGFKEVIDLCGVDMTPDHLVLTGEGWREAQTAASCGNTRASALVKGSASWSSLKMSAAPGTFWFGARAGASPTASTLATCAAGRLPAAGSAPSSPQRGGGRTFGPTQTSSPILNTDGGFSTGCPPLRPGAEGLPSTTAAGVSSSVSQTRGKLSDTSLTFRGGMTQLWSWIVSIATGTTRPVTSGSAPARRTCETSGRSEPCSGASPSLKRKSKVYDLVNAGPNRRFTILTDEGPLVVHNCELAFGYQGGVGAWRNFDNSDRHSDEQVEGYKKAWRSAHSGIVEFWYALERACVRAVLTNEPQETHGIVYEMSPCRRWLACRLPSGRLLWYYEPKVDMKPDFRGEMKPFVYYRAWRMGQWRVVDVYGGLLAENVTQATACDILMRAALRARKRGYNIVMRVHDELVAEMPHGQGSLEELVSIMVDPPAWAAHMCIPLAASGWEGERYRK